jgi:hypothetical protein
VLSAHLKSVQQAASNSSADCEFLYLVDPAAPERDKILWTLQEAKVPHELAAPKPAGANYAVTEATHQWNLATFGWLGAQKQDLLIHAYEASFDAIWLLDSDLIVASDTLTSLYATERPVVSAVFWTRWQPDTPALPQVWRTHPYGFDGFGEDGASFLRKLSNRELVRVRGLGACTLIRSEALQKVSFRPVPNLPSEGMWQGEDRHFCINAERAHVELWADAWPDIFHCYRPSDTEHLRDVQGLLLNGTERRTETGWEITPANVEKPRVGDLISLSLEPLEEPALASHKEHLRGRLGALPLLSEIEQEVLSMKVGEERFLPVEFPVWYPIEPYRSQRRLIRVKLLGAKPFRSPLPDGLPREVLATQTSVL